MDRRAAVFAEVAAEPEDELNLLALLERRSDAADFVRLIDVVRRIQADLQVRLAVKTYRTWTSLIARFSFHTYSWCGTAIR